MEPSPAQGSSPSETFILELRSALNHLYDPDFLRQSPLADILGVAGRFDTPSALQAILSRAIETLKPRPGDANKVHAQAVYDLLLYRYIQQFNQDEIANQLGISVRHLRRQQNLAIFELACRLWEQRRHEQAPGAGVSSEGEAGRRDQVSEELDWLKQPSGQAITDLAAALDQVRELARPFADQQQARLVFPDPPAGLIQVHPVAFQQIVLSLLSAAIQRAPGQDVLVKAFPSSGGLALEIRARIPAAQPGRDPGGLEPVQKMVALSEGRLEYESGLGLFHARVIFKSVDQINVLVIDDNPEIPVMLQRFTAETGYRITGLNDPKQALAWAAQIRADVIVLDIMMPQVDGLQVLSAFKHHPELGRLPVIVCSVLPQQDLAASLGASGFVQKPIQREVFLTALRQAGQDAG
jgi:CheY-like chemotaxis protein